MNLKYNAGQVEWNKQKEWKYQGDIRERMNGLRGTELAMPFHLLHTPFGLSPGGMDQKMAHWVRQLGAWKLQPYNSTVQMCIVLPKIFFKSCPVSTYFGIILQILRPCLLMTVLIWLVIHNK